MKSLGVFGLMVVFSMAVSPAVLAQPYAPPASPRATCNFNPGWKVLVGDPAGAQTNGFDDSAWKNVTLPYAWNEDSAFKVFISDLPTGIAWYRKHFVLPPGSDGKKVFLEFEGIRQGGEFYVNGQWIGRHENGVMAAGFDITTNALPYPRENVVAVRTDNSYNYLEVATGTNFQWNNTSFYANYGGINKNVRLHLTGRTYQSLPLFSNLGTVGTYLYAQNISISNRSAEIHAEAQVRNEDTAPHTIGCEVAIVDANGVALTNFTGVAVTIQPGQTNVLTASATVTNLNFWSWGYGYLYSVYTILRETNTVLDVVRTRTGFRKTQFTNGLVRLNDRPLQVKGYGQRTTDEWPAIGQSMPPWLSDFSQRLIVESGGNTVRWMHVTPSKQTVEACDRNGLMEAMPAGDAEDGTMAGRRWEQRKELMRDAIIYHRNSPSIIYYESGNDGISEAYMAEMKAIRNQYDPFGGRAIGCREMMGSTNAEYGGEMLYVNKSATKPMWMMEYSRDEGLRKYWDDYSPPCHLDGTGSSINGTSPANAYNRNQDSHAVENVVRWFDDFEQRPGTGTRVNAGGVNIIFSDSNTHCRGTQNYRRSGEVDALRIPKDNYFVHQVMWDGWVEPEHQHAHLIGHWNYTNGTVKNIYAASTAAAAELFLNGQSLGFGGQSSRFLYTWNNIAWTAGTLKVVGYDAAGVPVCEDERVTVGAPVALRLTPMTDPNGWKADGHDLAMFEVEVVDSLGRRCPTNLDLVTFALSGPAEWRGGIGVRSDTDPDDNYILSTNLPVACGVNRVLVRSTTNAGTVTLVAGAAGLLAASTNVNTIPVAVTNGLSTSLPGEGLPAYLVRGPTPTGSAYQVSRVAVPVAGITAGTASGSLTNTIDDNEATSWTSSSTLSQAWIQYTLARTTTLSQVVFKFTQTPRDDVYPLAIDINGTLVYSNTPPTTLGCVTLNLPPAAGNTVRVRRTTAGSFPIMEIEFYEAVPTGGVLSPAAPGGLAAASINASRIDLRWTDYATNELGFKLERSTDGVNFSQVAVPLVNATNHEDNNLVAGTTYFYRIRAFNAGGESDASNIASATTLPGPPEIPSGLTATAGDTVVMLNWDAANGASGYCLKRSTTNGGPYGVIARLAATSFTDTGLVNSTTCFYVVAATNALGQSADSAAVSARPVAMTIYEAENATLSGAAVASNQSGYSGTGYADYQNASGDYVEWTISAPFSGTYGLAFRYALPSGSRPLELKVNGVVTGASLAFPATGGWTTWALITNSASLRNGLNAVRLTAIGSSGGTIDYLHRLEGVPALPPRFAHITLSGTGLLTFTGTAGVTNGSYYVLVSTNLSLPFAQWLRSATNAFDAGGNFNFTNLMNPQWPQAFYRLELP